MGRKLTEAQHYALSKIEYSNDWQMCPGDGNTARSLRSLAQRGLVDYEKIIPSSWECIAVRPDERVTTPPKATGWRRILGDPKPPWADADRPGHSLYEMRKEGLEWFRITDAGREALKKGFIAEK